MNIKCGLVAMVIQYGNKVMGKHFGKMKYKKDWQGKRKDQVELSLSMVMGGLIGIVVCLLFSLVAVVGMEVWSWLCG